MVAFSNGKDYLFEQVLADTCKFNISTMRTKMNNAFSIKFICSFIRNYNGHIIKIKRK